MKDSIRELESAVKVIEEARNNLSDLMYTEKAKEINVRLWLPVELGFCKDILKEMIRDMKS